MSEENKFTGSTAFKIMSIALPVLTVGVIALGIILKGNGAYIDLITSAGYVLCFDFAYLFFLGSSETNPINNILTAVISVICPTLCFFVLYSSYEIVIPVVLFGLITLTCGLTGFPLSALLTLAVAGYSALFTPQVFIDLSVFYVYIIIACIFIRCMNKLSSLFFSLSLSLVIYCISLIIGSRFVLEDAFTLNNIITGIISLLLLTSVYFIKAYFRPAFECSSSSEDSTSKQNILKHDSNTRKEYETVIRNLKNEIKSMSKKLDSVTDEKDRIQAESVKITEENFDAIEQFKDLCKENESLKDTINELRHLPASLEECISSDFEFIESFKRESPKLFKHCQTIAGISSDAAQLIGCDSELAYALGIYHESQRLLGDDYSNILSANFRVPRYIVRVVELLKDKNNNLPMPREAGIVLLTDDIIATLNYLKSKNESVPIDRIVTNTIKVRKDQNILRLAGFSNEEVQFLKLFFIESGGNYDTSD